MKNLVRFLMAFIFISANSFAGNYTWTGTTNSSWSTSTNWSPNGVPGFSDSITINSTSTNLVLTAKQTVKRLTINGDTLDLGGDTLEITGSAAFLGGKINNGVCYPQCTGLLNFNSTTFCAEVKAKGQIKLNGCTFNNTAYFEHVGSAAGTGTGGNTFNGTTTLKNSGTSTFRIGQLNNDIFNGNAYVISASNNIQISYGAHTYFNGNVEFTSSTIYGINVGGTGNGYTYLASGKTITSGGSGIIGSFVLRNFIQYGTTSQSFSSNGSLNMTTCVFNGNLTCSAQALLLSGNEFHGATILTKTGTSSDFSAGGNHFYGNVTFINNATNTASLRLASTNGDYFDGDATFNTSTGQIQVAYLDTTDFKGHISSNNNAKVTFGAAGGYSNFIGVNEQILSGTGEYVFSKLIINKATSTLTLQKPIKIDSVMVLHKGVIKGDSTNKVTIGAAGSITEMSPQNYIEAAVLKIGNSAFTFPIGANGEYRPITMSAPTAATDKFEAQYYKQQQGLSSTLDTGLNYISTCNYWRFERIAGSSNVTFSTNWYNYSCDVFDVDSTKLAGLENGVWKNLGLMGYTGNDSSGSYSSASTISGYKYFTTAHQLFPNLSFEVTYDSTIDPVTVFYTNSSRGVPNDVQYELDFGRSDTIQNDSILFLGRSEIAVQYKKGGKYFPSLTLVQGINTQAFNYLLDLSVNANLIFTAAISSSTPHPNGMTNKIAACYDILDFSINISGLTSPCVIDVLSTSNLKFISGSESINNNTGTVSIVSPTQLLITPLLPGAVNATVNFSMDINSCNFTVQGNIPIERLLINCSQTYTGSILTALSIDYTQGNPSEIELTNLDVPEFLFIDTPNSHRDEQYSMGEIVEREYEIEVVEGIAPSFLYKLELEADVELLKLEVVDRTGLNNHMLIFNGQNPTNVYPCPTCLQPGSIFQFEFLNSSLYSGSSLTSAPGIVSSNQIVKVDLSAAIAISGFSDQLFTAGLYSTTTASNKILLRETVRIVEVNGCNINNDVSSINEIYPGCQSACTTPQSKKFLTNYNIKSEKLEPEFTLTLKVKTSSGYTDLYDGAFTSCYDQTNPSLNAINLALNFRNSAVPVGIPVGSRAAFVTQVQFTVNDALYEWDAIKIGNTVVPPAAMTWSYLTTGQHQLTIDLTQCNLDASTNDVSNDGFSDGINADFPTSNREYQFVLAGNSFNVILENFRIKDCTPASWPLKYANHSDYYILGISYIHSKNVCKYLTGSTSLSSYHFINLKNNFAGYATSTAQPLDVGTLNANPVLTFTFTETSFKQNQPQKTPWTIESDAEPKVKDVLSCPNIKYIFHLEIPVILNQNNDFVYRIKEVVFKDKNGVQIGNTLGWQLPPTSDGFYDFEVVGASSPVFTTEVELDISCDIGFGLNNFIGQYRAYCNDDCDNCNYIVYGESNVILHRHCNGNCDNVYVSTDNFLIERVTKGWLSETTYLAAPTVPDANNNSILKDRVYPCDVVKIVSTDGLVSSATNLGVPTLDELYFALLIDENQLNASNINLFSGLATGYTSYFKIEAKNGIGSDPCNNTTLNIPINWSNVSFDLSPVYWKPGYHAIKINLDKTYVDPNGICGLSALTLLRDYECTLSVEVFFDVNNLQLAPGFVELKAIFGEFVYQVGTTFYQSCDPYIQNLTYLQIQPKFTHEMFVGPYTSTLYSTTQCELLYSINMYVEGGYPQGDDFPNEFRPSLVFPSVFDVNHAAELSVTEAKFTNLYTTQKTFNFTSNVISVGSQSTTSVTELASTNGLKFPVDKNGSSDRYFYLKLWRNCPKTDPINPPTNPPSIPYLDIDNSLINSQIWYPGCNSPIPFGGDFYNVTDPDPPLVDYFNENKLKFDWKVASNHYTLEHPTSLPFELSYLALKGGSKCQNIWINFEILNSTPPNPLIQFDLYDVTNGTPVLVPSKISFILPNQPVFFLVDEIAVGNIKKYELRMRWNGCFGLLPFNVRAQYGVYCEKLGFPADIDNLPLPGSLPGNSCSTILHSTMINITPPNDNLVANTIHNLSQENRQDCETYMFQYKVENFQGDLSSARVQLQLPKQPFTSYPNCSVSLISVSVIINSITYPLTQPVAINGVQDWIYEWDIIQILINKLNSPHFNQLSSSNPVVFNFELMIQTSTPATGIPLQTVNFKCETLYNSTCSPLPAVPTGTTPPAADFFNFQGSPMPAFSIAQNVPYCGIGTIVNLAVTPADPTFTYSWSGPGIIGSNTASSINVNAAGNYLVTITSPTCGSSVTLSYVIEDNAINLNLVSNPAGNCGLSLQYLLENSGDPGTSVPGQPLYSYVWSYIGGIPSTIYPYTTPLGSGDGPFNVVVTHNGCTVSGSITIQNVTPQISIIGGGNYCEPSKPILTVSFTNPPSGIVNYLWSTGATTSSINAYAPKNGGLVNYSVTVSVGGCVVTANTDVINLTPEAAIVFDDHIEGYCVNSIIGMHSLYQNPGFIYDWSVSPGTSVGTLNTFDLDMGLYSSLPSSVAVTLSIDNQGCISTKSYSLNDITPTVQINPPYSHYNLCPGDPVNLTAYVLPDAYIGGNILYDYMWSNGSTSQSPTIYPPFNPSQWVYTVTVTNQNYSECNAQNSFQIINMNPNLKFVPPLISISPGSSASLIPLISNLNPTFSSYYWTWGGSQLPLTPTETDPTQTVSPSATTTYYLDFVAEDPFGISPSCSSSAAVTVAINGNINCPPLNPTYHELTQDILDGNIPPNVNASVNTSTGYVELHPNSLWWVKSQLFIDVLNLAVGSNTEILFSKMSGIHITSGNHLSIVEGGTLKACGDEMWDGINMQPNSSISLTGPTNNPVLIQDAKIGIYAVGNNISITCHGDVTFDKNNVSVHLENGNFNSAIFDQTKFRCSGQLLQPNASTGYTYRHVELIGAGTVNFTSGGGYQSNLFENAYTCIYSKNTNLNVKSCKFSNFSMSTQLNYLGTGIDFVVRTWPGMVSVPTLNVGYPNNGALPNEFDDFEIAINASGKAHVKLFDNIITNGNRGIRAINNSNQPALLAGSIYCGGNVINNIKSSGIILANNQYTPIAIISNAINPSMVNTPVDPLLETLRGIFIHNSTPTADPATATYLQYNTIVNCKHGIQTMNQNGGQIENNTISYFISDNDIRNTTTIYRRGIIIQGCENLQVTHNTISRPLGLIGSTTYTLDANMVDISNVPNQKVSLCGIFSGRSQNCVFRENIINQLPTAVHMNGDNTSNQFSCNHSFNGVEGFKLAHVFMSDQGVATTASGNDWVSWPTGQLEFTRIMGTGILNHPPIDWWYLNGNTDHDPVNGVTYLPAKPAFIQTPFSSITNCDDQPCFDCETERLYNLISFADTAFIEDALRYAIENYVYSNLKDSLQLMYSGSIWDASIQNFFTARALSNLGLLDNVEEFFSNDEYASSYLLNGELEATNLVENNLYEVNRICSYYKNEFDSLLEEDRTILETIAYQYPDVGGPAVYRARAILGLDIDDTQLQYRIYGEDSTNFQPQLYLYPNPAQDYLRIRPINGNIENPLEISIFDVYGKLLDRQVLPNLINDSRIEISNLIDGVYYLKVCVDEKCLLSDKFVKITSK